MIPCDKIAMPPDNSYINFSLIKFLISHCLGVNEPPEVSDKGQKSNSIRVDSEVCLLTCLLIYCF